MNIHSIPAFEKCYIMQHGDIRRFATTLANGFSEYNMFKYICDGIYNHGLMRLFWEVSLALLPDNAICIADSNDVNSVLVYIPPKKQRTQLARLYKSRRNENVFQVWLQKNCPVDAF